MLWSGKYQLWSIKPGVCHELRKISPVLACTVYISTPDQINLSKTHYIRLLELREEAREKLRCVLRQAGRSNEPLAEQAFAIRLAGGSIA